MADAIYMYWTIGTRLDFLGMEVHSVCCNFPPKGVNTITCFVFLSMYIFRQCIYFAVIRAAFRRVFHKSSDQHQGRPETFSRVVVLARGRIIFTRLLSFLQDSKKQVTVLQGALEETLAFPILRVLAQRG